MPVHLHVSEALSAFPMNSAHLSPLLWSATLNKTTLNMACTWLFQATQCWKLVCSHNPHVPPEAERQVFMNLLRKQPKLNWCYPMYGKGKGRDFFPPFFITFIGVATWYLLTQPVIYTLNHSRLCFLLPWLDGFNSVHWKD